jgi:DNA mismatch repair protein MutS
MRDLVLEHTNAIQETAAAFAEADVIASMAEPARLFGHVRPYVNETLVLIIRDGRHPVLDQNIADDKFVPNDTKLDADGKPPHDHHGSKHGGKINLHPPGRPTDLLAQTGAFIPASQADIGLVDRIFTRVGATDDLSRGQSTFMVEMNETSP